MSLKNVFVKKITYKKFNLAFFQNSKLKISIHYIIKIQNVKV